MHYLTNYKLCIAGLKSGITFDQEHTDAMYKTIINSYKDLCFHKPQDKWKLIASLIIVFCRDYLRFALLICLFYVL